MDRCTVKQKFAFDSIMTTSLGTEAHLKNTKHCVLITVLLHHLYLKFQYDIKRVKEKKALKLNKHNQFNQSPKTVKFIYYSVKNYIPPSHRRIDPTSPDGLMPR